MTPLCPPQRASGLNTPLGLVKRHTPGPTGPWTVTRGPPVSAPPPREGGGPAPAPRPRLARARLLGVVRGTTGPGGGGHSSVLWLGGRRVAGVRDGTMWV